MGYKAFIQTGSIKNKTYASAGSIVLPTKQRLSDYVRRSPIGNSKTKVRVINTKTGKESIGSKLHFSRVNFWEV
jgi:hypothetical protein